MNGQRIGPVDNIWLNVDRPTNLMVVDALLFFDEKPDWDRVFAILRHRLVDSYPVFRRRPVPARAPFGLPQWIDDSTFAIDRHIHRVTLASPGDDTALRQYVESRISSRLDRNHPLWEIDLVDRRRHGAALFVRMHHAIADGIALARLLLSITDEFPDPVRRGTHTRAKKPPRDAASSVRAPLWRRVGPRPVLDLLVHAERTAQVANKLLRSQNPHTPFDREPGPDKRVAWSRPFPLKQVKQAGRIAGATVNDVLMSALAGALSDYLVDHGASPVDLSTMVPVDIRVPDRPLAHELGNRFALVFLKLPIGVREPFARLAETKHRMDAIKDSPETALTFTLMKAIGRMSPSFERTVVDFFANKAVGVTTNVMGPPTSRYLAGAKVNGVLAWVPSSGRHTLGVCIVTYDGTVRVGFKVDARTVADPMKLVEAFDQQTALLLRVATAV